MPPRGSKDESKDEWLRAALAQMPGRERIRGDLDHPWIDFRAVRWDHPGISRAVDDLEARFEEDRPARGEFDPEDPGLREMVLRSALASVWIEANQTGVARASGLASGEIAPQSAGDWELVNLHRLLMSPETHTPAEPVDVKAMLAAHGAQMERLLPDPDRGALRRCQVMVGPYVAPTAGEVPGLADGLIGWLGRGFGGWDEPTPRGAARAAVRAFLGHLAFEQIHPFVDGNGRMGRWLETRLMLEHPLIDWASAYNGPLWYWDEQMRYYGALDGSARRCDPSVFTDFCAERFVLGVEIGQRGEPVPRMETFSAESFPEK